MQSNLECFQWTMYIWSACVFSGNEPRTVALLVQFSTSWVKCQMIGVIRSVTMSSGRNEVNNSLSTTSNRKENIVIFLWTQYYGMSIVYCAHYTKLWYNVIFKLTGGIGPKSNDGFKLVKWICCWPTESYLFWKKLCVTVLHYYTFDNGPLQKFCKIFFL